MPSAPTAFPDFRCIIYCFIWDQIKIMSTWYYLCWSCSYFAPTVCSYFATFYGLLWHQTCPKAFIECVKCDIALLSFIDYSFRSVKFVPGLHCSLAGQYSTQFTMIGVDYRVHRAATNRLICLSGSAVALVGLASCFHNYYEEEEPSPVSCHGVGRRSPMYPTVGFAARCH